jgi:RNA polymerase sigma factor (sigma-70 family)
LDGPSFPGDAVSDFFLPRVLLGDDAMNDTPDHELLRRYAEQDAGADAAFTELVRRHCDLVWAAARRVNGDADLARDVAQTVFTDLARKADKLPAGTVLAGWLYRAACHAAAKHIRGEARRAQRERQAMHQNELRSGDAEARAATELQPVLDAALADLTETDRDAVVLRFLAGRSLAEVGATLGTNEDAAQKRVSRALERLREAFRKRGVAVSGGIVAAALGVAGTQAAPAGLAGVIATASLASASAAAWGTFSVVTFMKSKLALGIVGGAIVATTLAWQQRNVTRLADENAGLRRRAAVQTAGAMAAPATDPKAPTRLQEEHAELLRLRGEVTKLRLQVQELSDSRHQALANQSGADVAVMRDGTMEAEISKREMMRALQYTTIMHNLATTARVFAAHHRGRLPTSIEELRNEMELNADAKLPGNVASDFIEFMAHERTIDGSDSQVILFRERSPRKLQSGRWIRLYCMADGSVQAHQSDDGDFSQFEREGTGTAANAPKRP